MSASKISTSKISTPNHGVILLASGLSQRLGQPKQLLNKNGEPLISHMLKLALATQPQVTIVIVPSHNPSITDALIMANSKHAEVKTVVNQTPEVGMGQSLYLGIEALNQLVNSMAAKSAGSKSASIERVLIMGVDQVLLDAAHLFHLLAGTSTVVASGYSNWRPLDKENAQSHLENQAIKNITGLPLVIDYAQLKDWQSKLSGDKGLRHLIRALPTSEIDTIENQQLSYDIDTPKELDYAIAQGWVDDMSFNE